VFDETSLPAALRGCHVTKPGVWGMGRILEGRLPATCLDPLSETQVLDWPAKHSGVIVAAGAGNALHTAAL
jgi:tellurite resistance-related uncharacterized protein